MGHGGQGEFLVKNKKVLVVGLGLHGGGVESVKWLRSMKADITITDLKTKKELKTSLNELKKIKGVKYHLGGHLKDDFLNADMIIKGPGVPADSPYIKAARLKKIPILSDIGIFLAEIKNKAMVIAVTGTKGKSTTASLIARVLDKKSKTHLAGNIRTSVFEILPKIKKGDLVVLELSSFQLEDISALKYSFPVAVITSLFPDHLNRHKTFANYAKAKEVVFKDQEKGGFLIVNGDDKNARRLAGRAKGSILFLKEGDFAKRSAYIIGKYFGLSDKKINDAIKSFKGLPGRFEKIAVKNGVVFINDTTATNPTAAIYGLKRVNIDYPRGKYPALAVIAGGYDKGLDVKGFVSGLEKSANFVVFFPGEASEKMIAKLTNSKLKYIKTKTMDEAVRKAYEKVRGFGGIVLLSPGAASFGIFKHEFDRGDKFVEAVRKIF